MPEIGVGITGGFGSGFNLYPNLIRVAAPCSDIVLYEEQ
jgi:hypothetical protein